MESKILISYITFFKTDTTNEMQNKIMPAVKLLDKYNQPYDVVYTYFVEEIVYEDNWQIAVRVKNGEVKW